MAGRQRAAHAAGMRDFPPIPEGPAVSFSPELEDDEAYQDQQRSAKAIGNAAASFRASNPAQTRPLVADWKMAQLEAGRRPPSEGSSLQHARHYQQLTAASPPARLSTASASSAAFAAA